MKLCPWVLSALLLLSGTFAQDGFDLSDALDDLAPTPAKPKEKPKVPEDPKSDGGLDLLDAFGPDEPEPEKPKPKPPASGDPAGGFNLEDAFGADPDPKPDKPAVVPPKSGGGGGSFGDSDLLDVSGGDYKPDGGHTSGGGGGGHAGGSEYDNQGGADQPQDPDLLWHQLLKMLNANMPEEFFAWMSNMKRLVTPLLERAMELLQAVP